MAKSKFAAAALPEEERGEYERWLPHSHTKMIPLDELHEHPDNWELVGRIDESRKKSLTEDMDKSGVREDLQVIYRDGKLILVSGHERRLIARDLGIKKLPCMKVEFETESAVCRHIFATNKHRKDVKLPPPKSMRKLFPPDEYPLLYADLRANYAYEGEKTPGPITLEQREQAREKRDEERRIQAEQRREAADYFGYTPEFTNKVVKQAAREIREEKSEEPEPREPTAAEIKRRTSLEKKLATLRAKMQKKNQSIESLKSELSDLKKDEKKLLRELNKLQ